ncbi:MAG: OB-fold domain-containing protein [Elusimicrobia bacterium]|nr:OB-fold domain-containing protein [Elusimicrobiota bacterium]
MPAQSRGRRRDFLTVSSGEAFQPFRYSVGRFGSRFFAELRDRKRFLGVRCPACRKVYCPPRPLCGPCYRKTEEWVELGPEGVIAAFTILRFAFVDPETGRKKPVPYGYGFIRLDGADTQLQHFLSLEPGRPPRVGARVRPVFEEERRGDLRDIRHFEVLD